MLIFFEVLFIFYVGKYTLKFLDILWHYFNWKNGDIIKSILLTIVIIFYLCVLIDVIQMDGDYEILGRDISWFIFLATLALMIGGNIFNLIMKHFRGDEWFVFRKNHKKNNSNGKHKNGSDSGNNPRRDV